MSFSLDRGFFMSVKSGIGLAVMIGADVKASLSSTLEFKAGTSFSYLMSTSATWGFGREFKKSKGAYTRQSDKDIVLDSAADAYVTGGKNDRTLLKSNDTELTLSFDDSDDGRAAMMSSLDAAALKNALNIAGLGAISTYVGAALANFDTSREGEKLDKKTGISTIVADYDEVSGLGWSDLPVAVGAFGSTYKAISAVKHEDLPSPAHPSPSAKITISKDSVVLFAGKDQESRMTLSKDGGLSFAAQKDVRLSTEAGLTVTASEKILIHSDAEIKLDAPTLRHRNMVVIE